MNLSYVLLRTKDRNGFQRYNGYENLTISEFKIFLQENRETIFSFEIKLKER
jgi:hypothetical protein